jgi:N-acetylmuramoyl-L-alanine amidase
VTASFLLALVLLAVPAGEPAPFTVVIDPGHGGTNLGAPAGRPGLYEKQVTLEIARRVRQRLASDRRIKVVLCRQSDVLVPVRARVRCANDSGARLFLSLHANASPETARGEQRGFELYVLPPAEVDQAAAMASLAAGNAADAAWAASRVRATAGESLDAARRLEWQLADALGPELDRGIKQSGASLDVLQGLKMPAVLVEMGFLDHVEEGPILISEQGWDRLATALAKAISDLRAREMRGRTDPASTASRPRARKN